MRLRWQEIDKALLVYREKWDVIAYSCASGLACLGVAVGAYLLSERPDAPRVFLSAFSFFFGLAGTALMLRLLVESRRIVGEPGFHVLSADSLGIKRYEVDLENGKRLSVFSEVYLSPKTKQFSLSINYDGKETYLKGGVGLEMRYAIEPDIKLFFEIGELKWGT